MALLLILRGPRCCSLGLLDNSALGSAFLMTPRSGRARREKMTQRAAWAALVGPVEAWVARVRKSYFLMF